MLQAGIMQGIAICLFLCLILRIWAIIFIFPAMLQTARDYMFSTNVLAETLNLRRRGSNLEEKSLRGFLSDALRNTEAWI